MLNFFKKKEPSTVVNVQSPEIGTIGVSTQPLLINPDFSENLKQKVYRIDAIERYTTQRAEEGRPIPEKKMNELRDEYQKLKIEVRQLKAQFEQDGGAV